MIRSYQVRGKTIEVDQLSDVLAVKLEDAELARGSRPGAPLARWRGVTLVLLEKVDVPSWGRRAFEAGGWFLVRPSDDEETEQAELPSPVALGRLFRDEHGECMIGAGRLSVRLRDDLDEDEAVRALERYGLQVVRRLKFAPYLYEVQVQEDDDFIEVAQRVHDCDDYAYAEPQLIRQMRGRGR